MFTHQELASYLHKNVFSDKKGKKIRINNLIPFPKERPGCKYRIYLDIYNSSIKLNHVKLQLLESVFLKEEKRCKNNTAGGKDRVIFLA